MSLPRGGLFDTGLNWSAVPAHKSHRTGHDVDFSSIDSEGYSINCIYQDTDDMKKAFKDSGVTYRECYSAGHYHARVS